jgi:hypothetical protein
VDDSMLEDSTLEVSTLEDSVRERTHSGKFHSGKIPLWKDSSWRPVQDLADGEKVRNLDRPTERVPAGLAVRCTVPRRWLQCPNGAACALFSAYRPSHSLEATVLLRG